MLASEVKISRDGNDVILALKGQIVGNYYIYDSLRMESLLDNDGDNAHKIERVSSTTARSGRWRTSKPA